MATTTQRHYTPIPGAQEVHKARLTDISIRSLQPPAKGNVVLWDDVVTGLGVRCSQGGTKSYFLLYGRQRARYQIGRVGIVTLADARAAARKFLAERTLGKRDAPALRFEDAKAIFLETEASKISEKTLKDYSRILRSRLERHLKGMLLTDIQTHHLTAIIDKLHATPAEANYTFAVARRFFRWAVGRRYIQHSPLEGLGLPAKTTSRERVLSPEELRAVWSACGDTIFGRIIKLCIILGQRRGEIAALRIEWINHSDRTITFPASIMKNRAAHTIPFPEIADPYLVGEGLLFPARGRETPFNGWSKKKAALDNKLGPDFAKWSIHDLRRSAATLWATHTEPHIIEALLSHMTFRQGVQGTYNRYRYLPQMREAIERHQQFLDGLLKQE